MPFSTRPISIFGVPMDLGQNRRGVDMGPSAIRYAALQPRLKNLGLVVNDFGNIEVPIIELARQLPQNNRMHNAEAIVSVCKSLHSTIRASQEKGERSIILGGDHSIALGSVSASLHAADDVGVLWVDAHGDFNTPEISPSGNVHGMVVAALMGKCPPPLSIGERRLRPDRIVMIATRDLDPAEKVAVREAGIKVMTMSEIDENGMADVVRAALRTLGPVEAIHVSFDMDSLDPAVAPGVGTPVSGGLTIREAHLVMELLADDGRVQTLDLVEVNPILDEHNRTAQVAVDLAASLFGQRII
ncbi:MAG: arginase [Anaerolineae bacterium]